MAHQAKQTRKQQNNTPDRSGWDTEYELGDDPEDEEDE